MKRSVAPSTRRPPLTRRWSAGLAAAASPQLVIGRDRCGCWSDFLLNHPMSNALSDGPMLPDDDLMRIRSLFHVKTSGLGRWRRHGCSARSSSAGPDCRRPSGLRRIFASDKARSHQASPPVRAARHARRCAAAEWVVVARECDLTASEAPSTRSLRYVQLPTFLSLSGS